MESFKRGDIIARELGPGRVEYSHLEDIGPNGKMLGISDLTGKAVGLDARKDVLRVASMDELLEARKRRLGRSGAAGGGV